MFERFDEHARKVVVAAQEEAKIWRHSYIGTEHLLAGLTLDGGLAGKALHNQGVSQELVREQTESIVGYGDQERPGPFTPESKKAIERALRDALQVGDDYIGPEHLLLGLMRTPDGNHIPILQALSVETEKVRSEVFQRLALKSRTTAEDPEDTNKRIAVALESIAKSLKRGWEMKTR